MSDAPITECWNCGRVHDGATAPGEPEATPGPGDFSLCIYCGAIAIYDTVNSIFGLRQPTAEETRKILQNKGVQELLKVWRKVVQGQFD